MTNQILTTKDYVLFRRVKGNRVINGPQVKRLAESIASNPKLSEASPIIVNKKMEVIDGQHRLEALKKLKAPVNYFVVDSLNLEDVQKLNSSTKTWGPVDYAKSYAERGYKDYKVYLEFKEKYNLPHSQLLVYLSGDKRNGEFNTAQSFRGGKFKVANINQAHKFCQQLMDVGDYYKKYKKRAFALALHLTMQNPKYDHNRMLKQLAKKNMVNKIKDSDFIEDHLRYLEKVYNDRYNGEDRIRLF